MDLTHGVPPFDVRAGALTLSRSVGHLGPGVVVAVVDPGVGSGRRAVAVSVGRRRPAGGPRYLVGPDNGLLVWAVDALGGPLAAVALTPTGSPDGGDPDDGDPDDGDPDDGDPDDGDPDDGDTVGATFDGRDLFGPVAARLWSGAGLYDVGLPIEPTSLVRLPDPVVRVSAGAVETEVLWVDRFGNVALAARAGAAGGGRDRTDRWPSGWGRRRSEGRRVRSFSQLRGDELGLMVDANGQLALVCDRRSAATVLGVEPGDMVTLRPLPDSPPGPTR